VPPFHHLAIQCRDLPACEHFYREVLGLPVLRRWPRQGGGDRAVWLDLGGGAFLALERAEGEPGQPARAAAAPASPPWRDGRPGFHLLALAIGAAERAGWEARLAAAGFPVAHRTRWTSYVLDPEGNRIGLSHHPEDPA
jgi:catechol 2,3-dioxygenase-like lactoylglutathione lyase family enzyme